tara:strand:+ start:60 stop:476 length:417 start_codon:yes stop_codon:yes gene_type:complete
MKNLKSVHILLLTLSVITIGGCAPMLLAGGAVVGAKGYVNDTEHEKQLGKHSKEINNNLSKVKEHAKTIKSNLSKVEEHAKTIDSNLLKLEENKNHINALHERIKMLESIVINLQKLLVDKPQPTQVIEEERIYPTRN